MLVERILQRDPVITSASGSDSVPAQLSYLRKINTESIHVEAIEKTGKALAEPGQALVHQLEMHHVGFEIGHGIRELGERGLEGVERKRGTAIGTRFGGVAE